MELKQIKTLAQLMDEHGLSELELQQGEDRLKLSRQPCAPAAPVAAQVAAAAAPPTAAHPPAAIDGDLVNAPLVGSVYLAAGPDEKPFTAPGSAVKKGQTLCIIEAMKVMNELPAPRDGVVAEVLVENEQLVEFGQPLFRLQ